MNDIKGLKCVAVVCAILLAQLLFKGSDAFLRHPLFVRIGSFRVPPLFDTLHNDKYKKNKQTKNNNNDSEESTMQSSSSSALSQAQLLQAQLQALRQEIQQDVQNLQQHKEALLQKKRDKVDQWIDTLLVATHVNGDTQMLHSVETVAQTLMDERFSPEQVNAIFERMTQDDPLQRVESPLVELLVDACNLVDCRDENPNKRWNERVEMKLRRKMFAMQWGIELEEEKERRLYD
ncbi:hypothetical protein FisN_32Hh078 [Fistulifera solaris]|uniref:Uncharacterized protein n=1 Tax=Fistulifera solaris TaxID=1519565 RepID=A0A1Z5K3B0_FISSO|nr:hypothetical protein FisN_32Hh078 [Fistulifera solaris]|eukprot:GAX20689.1 hypothetical protein FisN_32Hh078 [Fistulifera solaris]